MPDTHQRSVLAESLERTEYSRTQAKAEGHVICIKDPFLDSRCIDLVGDGIIYAIQFPGIDAVRQTETRCDLDRPFYRQRQADGNTVLRPPLECIDDTLQTEQRIIKAGHALDGTVQPDTQFL